MVSQNVASNMPLSLGTVVRYHVAMSERFYFPDPLSPGPITLTGPEAHHMAHVLRLKAGAEITLFNGDGNEYPARLDKVNKSHIEASVLGVQATSRERLRQVTIACPLPKGDRAMFLIEKLTELGVTRYIPLRTQRSVVHPGEGKIDKLHRQVIEANKQCGRNVLMDIEPMQDWPSLVADATLPAHRYLADASGNEPLTPVGDTQKVFIALGAEGGWAVDELNLARTHGWQLVTLGPAILRIETAAIAAAVLGVGVTS